MARLARLEIAGAWYHVINRGHERRAIFRDRRCYQDFLERLAQLPARFGLKIHAYVLMPNHYHLELGLGTPPALSAAMHWLNTGYGIWFNRRYQRSGALFQGRFKAILFDPQDCLSAIHDYIHLNPVRVATLKLTKAQDSPSTKELLARRRQVLRDFEWSSYRDYAGLRSPPPWLTVETVREHVGLSAKEYRRKLDRRISLDQLGLDWQGELAAGILMGAHEAVGKWKRLLDKRAGPNPRREHRRFGVVTWQEIVGAIEQEWQRSWEELRQSRGVPARALAIWFGRHRAGMTLEQIRAELGTSSYSAVAMQVGRLQRQLAHRPTLRKKLRAIAERLNVQC
jgi:REP element-mobilizing transposase RayT